MSNSTPSSSKKKSKKQKNKTQQATTTPIPITKQSGSGKKDYEYLAKISDIDELVSQIESTQKKKQKKKQTQISSFELKEEDLIKFKGIENISTNLKESQDKDDDLSDSQQEEIEQFKRRIEDQLKTKSKTKPFKPNISQDWL